MENVPDDILRNIFIRLQAKHVAQLRCLSKPMNALLCNPSFIKSHLDRSTNNNNDETHMIFHGPFYLNNKSIKTLPNRSSTFIRLPGNAPSEKTRCNVIGSLNGLICFSSDTQTQDYLIHIWNPSLSALLHLPPSTISYHGFSVFNRFGYDPKTDDYKVVKLCSMEVLEVVIGKRYHGRIYSFKKSLQVQVYSMRKGSWGLITQIFPSHVTRIYDQSGICEDGHNGYVHWLGELGKKKLKTIVAFDLGSETFNEISLPHSIQDYNKYVSFFVCYMCGMLCVMSCSIDLEYEVWMMIEYGVAESWVKHLIFPRQCNILRPFGFILNNVFLFEDHNNYLALYDPNAAKVKSIDIKACSALFASTKVVRYIDSLVWVAPTKRGN